ncbi:hypothetical protein RJ641_026399 [Dillenia turbinata]|uniref:Protein EFR3 n=1 Tax=Dillenia turbinata TaxID=194707 RepID=A0AAN8WG35_9MAGN
MSVISGVISRKVLPACGSLCFFCPAMRARSRQPVKRYKKLIADIFPRSPDEEPNDRKIGKLCEYAAKNPLRIPKITTSLEQRCYKELRNENFRFAKVWFMGEHSHISVEFDNIVSVVLENYGGLAKASRNADHDENRWVQQVAKVEGHDISLSQDVMTKVPSWRTIVNEKGKINVAADDANNPCFWSRVSLCNMANLAREATTIRRVLESLFRYFDNGNLWSLEKGIALPVLMDMQLLMDSSGENTHYLISILVKHLDHKNVLKQPDMQLDIVEVTTSLARQAKVQSSVTIIGAVSDVMRHLRKSIHCSIDDDNLGADIIKWNRKFREAVDECLVQLSCKVGDAGPILDLMAGMLENISTITVIARTTTAAVYRTAQIAFPEALFHQLLISMLHPDYETRVGVHRIFSVVLVPSSVCPCPSSGTPESKNASDLPRTLSRTVSVFSSSAALFDKLRREKFSSRENNQDKGKNPNDGEAKSNVNGMLNRLKSSYSRVHSSRHLNVPSTTEGNSTTISEKEKEAYSLRLSSRQISLLLSSIWSQSISPANMPENYEAIAHTYGLILLFSRAKQSSHEILVRSFHLAMSLRSISLSEGVELPPSRRRSLFTLATSMMIFLSKAYNILPLVSCAKAVLMDKKVDPYLRLVGDSKLQAVNPETRVYGSKEDDNSALKSLSEVKITKDQTKESFASMIISSLENLSDSESSKIREELLLNEFLPDDVCPLTTQLHQLDLRVNTIKVEATPLFTIDDDGLPDSFESQTKPNELMTLENPDLLSVNQLLESILETAHQVGRYSVSTAPDFSYVEMAHHCESLLMGKQQKMSNLMSVQQKPESSIINVLQSHDDEARVLVHGAGNPFIDQPSVNSQKPPLLPMPCATEFQQQPQFFRLPASSPFGRLAGVPSVQSKATFNAASISLLQFPPLELFESPHEELSGSPHSPLLPEKLEFELF